VIHCSLNSLGRCLKIIDTLRYSMATKLDKSLKREFEVNGELYMLTISPEGMKLVPKGKRKGHELTWKDLISGQTALAVALNASLERARG
jgi:hypothetical protein